MKFTPEIIIINSVQEEFIEYHATTCIRGTYDTPETEDIEWIWYGGISKRVDASPGFKHLSMVAKLVLCIPHSNAGEERVFNS